MTVVELSISPLTSSSLRSPTRVLRTKHAPTLTLYATVHTVRWHQECFVLDACRYNNNRVMLLVVFVQKI